MAAASTGARCGAVHAASNHVNAALARRRTALDKASQGGPVMLRDDSLHNRWVNSRALEIGADALSFDPAGGSYLRDAFGPVGLLFGQASTAAELAARQSIGDWRGRDLWSARTRSRSSTPPGSPRRRTPPLWARGSTCSANSTGRPS
jgi:predicted amidohydrolase YtcJ